MSTQDDVTTRLLRLDACAVSDALDKLGLSGCVTTLSQLSSQRKIAGRAHTVKLVGKEGATGRITATGSFRLDGDRSLPARRGHRR